MITAMLASADDFYLRLVSVGRAQETRRKQTGGKPKSVTLCVGATFCRPRYRAMAGTYSCT